MSLKKCNWQEYRCIFNKLLVFDGITCRLSLHSIDGMSNSTILYTGSLGDKCGVFFHYPHIVQLSIYTGTIPCGEYLTSIVIRLISSDFLLIDTLPHNLSSCSIAVSMWSTLLIYMVNYHYIPSI